MHRSILFFLFALLAATGGRAQQKVKRALKEDTGKLYLRFNPLGPIDPWDGNITPGAEYRFNDTWAATLDAGAILYSAYFGHTKMATGFLLRPGIRMYPGRSKDFFIDMQFHYKEVTYQIRNWLEKDVVANVASYEEYKLFKYKKQVMGGRVMVGVRNYFAGNPRLYMEAYVGLGIHYKVEGLHNEPGSQFNRPWRIISDNPKQTLPAFPLGVRFIYKIR
ncbi:hypothetical protein [Niastella populi]|uniref:DUF3575 domain-containing protein n=1 Tax=Niastella populi TaxID=550983 RepID=A0A1V9ET68_9BACT|nr:hypothetical protein [Niastella populi]OQP49271.1 hypothetical protein A4R26_30970 [Niastella populi]